ncbi:MAG: DDE-type integrase/transposase/recombinase [Candidatus Nealsonbacteria bacterium]|nr:DDE-type integrase/transposase/recombinase [Candidatus Nealsonbacteria bacterium]
MKGKYSGRHMTIYGSILPGAITIARSSFLTDRLTERAKYKIKILDWHKGHGNNMSLTARHFGIGRMTLFRWLKRFKHYGIIGLNEYSRKPKHLRKPTTNWNILIRTVELRKQYPAWSKYKIGALLKREGIYISESTVGRILKRRNLIDKRVSAKRRKSALRPKARFPRGFKIHSEGDMVQMDTKYIMLPGGHKYYQFTAIDVLSKRRTLRVYPSQSSRNGADFLKECLASFPFQIKTIQTDNGSPFLKEFDKLCKELNLPHYFIYPRTPKQNSYVEISHGADEREFYQQGNSWCILSVMQKKIREWEDTWNNVRPHEALNQMTPNEYLFNLQNNKLPTKNVIVLQT